MADSITKTVNSKKKDSGKIPAGATVVNKKVNVDIEEIENGYLITKNISIDYRVKGSDHTDYAYFTKRWYSEEDPLTINTDNKELADFFN